MDNKKTDKILENKQLFWMLQRIKMKEAITSYHDELMFETHELINSSLKIDERLMLSILRRLVNMNAITEIYTLTKDKRLNSSEDLLIFDTESMFESAYKTYDSDSDFVSREIISEVINDPDTWRDRSMQLYFNEPQSLLWVKKNDKKYKLPMLEKAVILAILELKLKKGDRTDWAAMIEKIDIIMIGKHTPAEHERMRNIIRRLNRHIYEKLHITNKTCFIWDAGTIIININVTTA